MELIGNHKNNVRRTIMICAIRNRGARRLVSLFFSHLGEGVGRF